MFPTINKKETGVNLRRIMDMRGVKPKDIQEYLGFGCVQSVYRWLDGVSMPTVDNLYAISKMLQVPTMIMECHLWQCTGSTVSIIWLVDTMTSTGCRCQTSHLMYADTRIVQIWQNRE
jgi:hypothetical protein